MNSISLACLHVRCNPMGRTCRQAGEIKNPARARFLFDGCFVFCFATYRLRVLTMCRMVSSTVSRVWSLDRARWSISSSCKTVRGGCTATVQWWSGAGTPYLPTAGGAQKRTCGRTTTATTVTATATATTTARCRRRARRAAVAPAPRTSRTSRTSTKERTPCTKAGRRARAWRGAVRELQGTHDSVRGALAPLNAAAYLARPVGTHARAQRDRRVQETESQRQTGARDRESEADSRRQTETPGWRQT